MSVRFTKGDTSEAFYLLDFTAFLANEGTGVTISSIASFALKTGDTSGVVIGTTSRATALTSGGTKILFWLEGGTNRAEATIEYQLVLSNTEEFPGIIKVNVTDSTF
jgi:uncharacterized cupin superfamily protein